MLKNLLTKKLYQFCFFLVVFSYLFIIKSNSALAYELISGTSCYKAQIREVVGVSDNSSYITFGTNFVRYEIPSNYVNKKGELLCLKTPKYDKSSGTVSIVANEYRYFAIKNRGSKNYFEKCLGAPGMGNRSCSPDTDFDSLNGCIDSITKKFYSEVTNDTYTDLDSCKNAVDLNQIPITPVNTSSECYSVPDQNGYRSIAFYDDNLLGSGPFNETCQCFTQNGELTNIGRNVGVFYRDANGRITEYASFSEAQTDRAPGAGSTTQQQFKWFTAARKCLQENSRKYFNSGTGGCYDSAAACRQSNCVEDDEGSYFIDGVKKTSQDFVNEQNNCDGDIVCLRSLSAKTKRCDCSQEYNARYSPTWCTVNPNDTTSCGVRCKLLGVQLSAVQPVTINSPLALIKVVVNFLFWLAVVIFILNMLSAALDYIKGGDQPDKLKEASDRITGTIFGFVFLLVASGVINYIIERVNEFIP